MMYLYPVNFKPYAALCLLILLGLGACRNDLKLNAPYREMPSIYAVLNPDDTVQIIRINKVFLGEGDANVMAKVADSVNYGTDELTVTLTRSVSGKQYNAGQKSYVVTFRDSTAKIME